LIQAQRGHRLRRGNLRFLCVWCLLVVTLSLALAGCRPRDDTAPATPPGTIEIKGSDTLVNLALAWVEGYQLVRPDVRISVTGGGSGTGIASMINGTVDIAAASRDMTNRELEAARAAGMDPVEFVVALDAIAIIVHLDNPIEHLTLQQIADIYTGRITNWSELGSYDRPIVLLSRESNSGTYVYFLENVLRREPDQADALFSPDSLLMPSSEGISAEVRQNRNAIGYDGLGYVTPDKKVVPVGLNPEGPFVLPSVDSVNDGTYVISRPLYMYTTGEPTGDIRDFLDWLLTDGQQMVRDLGFVPLD
jgi:phosphate transport system substrate-binding protein